MTSEEVRPKCSQRADGPTLSATAVVNAMTSCCVVCSISLDTIDIERGACTKVACGVRRDDACLGHRIGGRQLDIEPGLVPALIAPDRAHFRMGVPC